MKKSFFIVSLLLLFCVPGISQAQPNPQIQQDLQDQQKKKPPQKKHPQVKPPILHPQQNHPQVKPPIQHPQQNHPQVRPYHTSQYFHERQNRFRQDWVNWKQMHPNNSPNCFILLIDNRPYFLSNIHPEIWYYHSDPVEFIVPEGYVVLSEDQEWYPGKPVNTAEFVLFTKQAYSALDQ